MSKSDATTFVKTYASTEVSPTLTEAEVELCLAASAQVDPLGNLPGTPDWIPTYWATRAVVLALDMKVAKVTAKTDLVADGAQIHASQVIGNLERLRASWRSRMLPGSV